MLGGEWTSATTVVILGPNSPPTVSPTGGGVFELGPTSFVTLGGEVTDTDGDLLTYAWTRIADDLVLPFGTVDAPDDGSPIALPSDTVATTTLGIGSHILEVAVNDGTVEVTGQIEVEVIAAEAPVLTPVPSDSTLWPPDGTMREITIQANATDNSGGAVTLSVKVTSDEPAVGPGDPADEIDWEILDVDSETGLIRLNLRAERLGNGDDRTYTVTITATDEAGNVSITTVEFAVPHDQRGD